MDTTTNQVEALDLPILHVVSRSRAGRKLAIILGVLLLATPLLLAFTPWQQNVGGTGRVTVLEPSLRIRNIPAPIAGRLVELMVQEGSVVEKGDVLARMEDQDSSYFMRLETQLKLERDKVEYAHSNLQYYDNQLIQLGEARDAAIAEAQFEFSAAVEEVIQAEEDVQSKDATLLQKTQDYQRKKGLFEKELMSELKFEEAKRDLDAAAAAVKSAKAKVKEQISIEKGKEAKIEKIRQDQTAKMSKTESDRQDAQAKLAAAKQTLQDAESLVSRQQNQTITAPTAGTILSIQGAANQDLISKGSPLIEFVPSDGTVAVELFVRGIDAPLISAGRKSRLQFEGWPAVQTAGWPSVAVGTFGGVVSFVEAQAQPDGRVRVLIVPDPDEDTTWPDQRFLRQGVRVNGWVQLDTVSVGYEMWRQLNAFPPESKIDSGVKKGESPRGVDESGDTGSRKKSKS